MSMSTDMAKDSSGQLAATRRSYRDIGILAESFDSRVAVT